MGAYLEDYFFVLGEARRKLPTMVLLLLFSALLDIFGLGLIAPLIGAITNAGSVLRNSLLARYLLTPQGSVDQQGLFVLAALVVIAFAAKGATAFFVQLSITRFSEQHRGELMRRLLVAYLAKPYEFHMERNSASLIATITTSCSYYAFATLAGSVRLAADLLMLLAIIGFLAWTNLLAVAILVGLLAAVFAGYVRIVRYKTLVAGKNIALEEEAVVQAVTDAIGPVREVRILGVQDTFTAALHQHALNLARWNGIGTGLQYLPRYVVEIAMVLFVVLLGVISVSRGTPVESFVPTLGVFGVAALRLMPASTSIMSGFAVLRQSRHVLSRLAGDLRLAGPEQAPTLRPHASRDVRPPFGELRFSNVTYTYPTGSKPAVSELSFKIVAGQAVGLVGRTGSGKSTTADLLLGLIHPQQGEISVDGRNIREDLNGWMRKIAYIPQAIYLTDDSLRRNIAFGIPDTRIDHARVDEAIEMSQLADVVARLPAGLDTKVGERGVRLSGGQRQRVALARALYHSRELIVMDEATAALDTETEREVVRAIARLRGKKTLIIIAHRESTLEGCDFVIRLTDGRISNEPERGKQPERARAS